MQCVHSQYHNTANSGNDRMIYTTTNTTLYNNDDDDIYGLCLEQ